MPRKSTHGDGARFVGFIGSRMAYDLPSSRPTVDAHRMTCERDGTRVNCDCEGQRRWHHCRAEEVAPMLTAATLRELGELDA